jgi:hypothetical protein
MCGNIYDNKRILYWISLTTQQLLSDVEIKLTKSPCPYLIIESG